MSLKSVRTFSILVIAFCLGRSAFGQTASLALSSASTTPGGTVSLNLSLASPSGSEPVGIQWTLNYSPVDIPKISIAPGPVAAAAGKSVTCSAASGSATCLLTGINVNTVSNGVAAIVTATVSAAATNSTAISVTNPMAPLPSGAPLPMTATGGTITVITSPPMGVSGLTCTPQSLITPASATCTVSLNQPAPSNTSVTLTDDNTALTTPGSVTVVAGASSATFAVSASSVSATQTAVVTAKLGSSFQTASLTLLPLAVTSLQCSPSSLLSGDASACTVTLNQAATATTVVALKTDNSLLAVPASVSIPVAANSAAFTAAAGTVTTTQAAIVTATLGASSQTDSLMLAPPVALSSLQCPASLAFGSSGMCTVALNRIALKQITVSISDNSKALQAPSIVKVPAGSPSASFPVTAGSFAAQVTVIASYDKVSQWATISVTAAQKTQTSDSSVSSISSFTCSPSTLIGSATADCTVSLAQPAPASGTSIKLSSDAALHVPEGAWASPGSTSAQFTVRGQVSDTDLPARIVASTPDGQATARLDVLGITPVSLACQPKPVRGGDPVTCEVQLNSAEIPDVLSLEVKSSSSALQVPKSVTTRPRQSTLSFQAYGSPGARQQTAVVQIGFGTHSAKDNVITLPGSGPLLEVPEPQLAKPGLPVSFTVSASDGRGGPVSLMASSLPAGASFDPATGRFFWVPRQSQQGSFEVKFTAVSSLQGSATRPVRIEVGSGRPVITTLANGASRDTKWACSSGGIASLLGTWLVQDGSTWSDPSGQATALGGTEVSVNGETVPVLYASGRRVDFQCPQAVPGTPLQVQLTTNAHPAAPLSTTMQDAAPGILTADGSGRGQGMILFPGMSAMAIVRNPLIWGQPAQPGDTLAIRATGIPAGAQMMAKVGGIDVVAESVQPVAGSAGVYEVLVTVPTGVPFGDAVPVKLEAVRAGGEVRESNVVTMAVEPVRP